jgi:hypothetical protein
MHLNSIHAILDTQDISEYQMRSAIMDILNSIETSNIQFHMPDALQKRLEPIVFGRTE